MLLYCYRRDGKERLLCKAVELAQTIRNDSQKDKVLRKIAQKIAEQAPPERAAELFALLEIAP